ncbi:MAG: iron-containing alcohol dehydrogenase, partial [Planctomycetes bacterium]|nr:iron-containing alcohol dehydrogenase [Planctomycetota bacterium]
AFIVIDPGVRKAGGLDVVEQELKREGIDFEVFDEVEPEPARLAVDSAAEQIDDDVDVVIAIGGGSTMDQAKGMRIVAECGGSIRDYKGGDRLPEFFRIGLICIPSTSGTGSEVSWGGVYTDEENGLKFPVSGRSNAPDVALVDPQMTATMPPRVTAMTGCDTLVHAVESYLSNFATPLTEALSLRAIELAAHSLPQAFTNGRDMTARDRMARACTLAAMAFNTSRLGMAHGVCLPLAAKCKLPHGLAVAVMLPYVLEFNQAACGKKLSNLAHALGVEVRGADEVKAADRSVEAIRRLYEFIGIPLNLRGLEVTRDVFDEVADLAMGTHQVPANPRKIESKEEIIELLNSAY